MTVNIRAEKVSSREHVGGLTLCLLLACSVQIAPADAADFSHAQKVVVPASSYSRHIDFSSIREQYSKNNPKTASTASKSTPKPAAKASTAKPSTVKTAALKAPAGKAPVKTIATAAPKISPVTAASTASSATKPLSSRTLGEIAQSFKEKVPASMLAKMKAQAEALQKSGKLDEAQRVWTKVVQMKPEDKAALQQVANVSVQRAKNYISSNKLPEALLAARQALAANPSDTEAHSLLSDLYKKVGADPTNINSRLQTAHSLYSQGRYQEAEVEYRASLNVKPTADAHIGLGKVAQRLQGDTAGKAHFEHALELDSNSAPAHRELGMHHFKSGDLVTANSELSRALILDPKDKDASQSLVNLWQGQVSKVPSANSHLGLARAYQLSGDLPSAQAEYREVVRIDPNHPSLPAARQSFKIAMAKQEAEKAVTAAKSLESQGLLNDAYQKMSEAVGYAPGNSAYKIYQGELLEKMGQASQAKSVYLTVLKDDPQNLTAVQKIKSLGSVAAAATATGLSAAGLAAGGMSGGLLPGGSGAVGQPYGFPGTKFPLDMTSDSSMLSAANGGVQGIDHVGSLSNFMTDVRNHMLTSNVANKKAEDAAHKIIKQLTDPDPEPAASAGAAGASAAGQSDDDIIKKILGSPSPSASTAAASSSAESGAASALANAAAALAAAKGGSTGAAATSSAAKAAPGAVAPAAKPLTKSSALPSTKSSQIAELQKQNQALQQQLKTLQAQAQTNVTMPSQANSMVSAAGTQAGGFPQVAPSFNPASAAASLPGQLPYASSAAGSIPGALPYAASAAGALPYAASAAGALPYVASAAGSLPYAADSTLAMASPLGAVAADSSLQHTPPGFSDFAVAPPAEASAPQLRGMSLLNNSSSPVKFELKNIKPTLTHVQLKVALTNDSNAALEIPNNLQAVVRYPNQSESEMKIAFDSKTVPAHGAVEGTVKVPFNKVDPSADMVLRNLLPNQELHIIKTGVTVAQQ